MQNIHRFLSQDVYEWAGQIRQIDISKAGGRFCSHNYIVSYSQKVAQQLQQKNWLKNLDLKTFSQELAYFFGEFNAIHPFRDGNGRSIREFFWQLAKQNNYTIFWENIKQEELIRASKLSLTTGNNEFLEQLIKSNIA